MKSEHITVPIFPEFNFFEIFQSTKNHNLGRRMAKYLMRIHSLIADQVCISFHFIFIHFNHLFIISN